MWGETSEEEEIEEVMEEIGNEKRMAGMEKEDLLVVCPGKGKGEGKGKGGSQLRRSNSTKQPDRAKARTNAHTNARTKRHEMISKSDSPANLRFMDTHGLPQDMRRSSTTTRILLVNLGFFLRHTYCPEIANALSYSTEY